MKYSISTILFILIYSVASGQVLENFYFSECLKECRGDSTKIDKIYNINNLTQISFTAYANCSADLEGRIELINDTLNLIYSQKLEKIEKNEAGEDEYLLEVTMCDCIFKFNYSISGLKTFDKNKIKLNGKTLDELNKNIVFPETPDIEFEPYTTWSSENVFTIVDNAGQFPGGYEKFNHYIESNLIYPNDAKKKGISGKVFIEFIINKDGSIDDPTIRVLRGLNKSCNKEAIRLINHSPDWTPAKIKGIPVKQKYVLPIIFTLSSGN